MRIVFLLPGPASGPIGGHKVIIEYANRLVACGHQVHLAYAGSLFWKSKSLIKKIAIVSRYLYQCFRGYSGGRWFQLDTRVQEHLVWSLNQRHVPEAEAYICTTPQTAMYLNDYQTTAKQVYFIQGYELWGGITKEQLHSTYHYPFHRIVVATWLQRLLHKEEGLSSTLIFNGFDFKKFYLKTPIEQKAPLRITMLYHTMELKDLPTGFAALRRVQQLYPDLRVNLFGAYPRPTGLEPWYDYYQSPDATTHQRLYDEAAIFVGTSRSEGWGLTVGEAMMCGQAVCCTDNEGYKEMATHGKTALVSPIGDANALAENIITLIQNDKLRHTLAVNAYTNIQKFTWEKSFEQFLHCLER